MSAEARAFPAHDSAPDVEKDLSDFCRSALLKSKIVPPGSEISPHPSETTDFFLPRTEIFKEEEEKERNLAGLPLPETIIFAG